MAKIEKTTKEATSLSKEKMYEFALKSFHHYEERIENVHKFYVAFCSLVLFSMPYVIDIEVKSKHPSLDLCIFTFLSLLVVVLLFSYNAIVNCSNNLKSISEFMIELEKDYKFSLSKKLFPSYLKRSYDISDQKWCPIILLILIISHGIALYKGLQT